MTGADLDPDEPELFDDLLTIDEGAALARVHPQTLRAWVSRGDLAAYRLGRRKLRVRRSELVALLRPVPTAKGKRRR